MTKQAVELIKKWEGFRSEPYQDVAGVWTIGVAIPRSSFYSKEMDKLTYAICNPLLRGRILEKINKYVNRGGDDECWPWIAKSRHPLGYGHITCGRKYSFKAHRVAWALKNGPIPKGMYVCHKCDNPKCCNPNHLFVGTPKDNTDDMNRKGRGHAPPITYGEKHHNTKITAEQALSIKNDARVAAAIAEQYNISTKTVYRLKRGETWKQLA